MDKKTTKRSLVASVMALVMCVTMLVGTTFAWFTDTASTGVNKIQAGNLKMEVSYKNTQDGEFLTVNKETPVLNNNALWEPGHVEYAVLKIQNVGTLALKYKLGINIASETGSKNVLGNEFKLSDYIRFAVIEGDLTLNNADRAELVAAAEAADNQLINAGYTSDETHLLAGATDNVKTVTLVVWMPESVGNEANYAPGKDAPVINLGIDVVATQDTVESDSFGNTYDEKATYPVVNAADFSDAITSAKDGDVIALTGPVDFADETVSLDKDITISGDDAVIKNALFTVADGKTVAFDGVTVSDTVTIRALNDASLKFTDCEFNITPQSVNSNKRAAAIVGNHQNSNVDLTLEGCTFKYNYTAGANEDLYNMAVFMWSNVENVLIKNCQFNDYGFVAVKFLEMKAGANIVFEGNTFNMSCRTDSNWYYNTAVQIHTVNQPTGACHVSFINNVYSPHNTGVPDPQPESPRHGRHRSPKEEEAPCPCM